MGWVSLVSGLFALACAFAVTCGFAAELNPHASPTLSAVRVVLGVLFTWTGLRVLFWRGTRGTKRQPSR